MNNEIKQNQLTMDEIHMVNKVTKMFVVFFTGKENKNNIGKKNYFHLEKTIHVMALNSWPHCSF